MEILIIFLVSIILIFLGAKGGRLIKNIADDMAQRAEDKRYFQREVLSNLESIKDATVPQTPRQDPVENLLQANRELLQKKQVHNAIKEELGIEL